MITQPSLQTYFDAKSILLQGDLVAFPTETVYGLGANALDILAVQKIFQTKGRPQTNPIIVHLGFKEQISDYAIINSSIEQKIIDKLMPGPITILLQKKQNLPDIVTAGSQFVGIRIPSNQVALDLLQTVNIPIAAPSANVSTRPSPTSAKMVRDNFGEKVPLIIDGGSCEVGIESTVVKVEGDRVIITRPGFITQEDIQNLFSNDVLVSYAQKISEITPGNMFKHYSPNARVSLIKDDVMFSGNQKTAIIVTQSWIDNNQGIINNLSSNFQVILRGNNLISCANRLFELYHQCDKNKFEQIFIESLPEIGLGYAIMNRVKKSVES